MENYIYERAGWPNLSCEEAPLRGLLAQLHRAQGRLYGKLDALGFEMQDEQQLKSISDELVTSFEIEGVTLNRSSVRSSVAKRLGLETAGLVSVPVDHNTEGAVAMALDATQNFFLPVTVERLLGWHSALFPSGYSGVRRITTGAYRLGEIAIVSGVFGKEKIHYKAPPPERVPGEMSTLLKWIGTDQGIDPYVKSGIAHLWFELIHPFDDGNGRIGRAIADLLLARADNSTRRYYSLSSQLMKERDAYYNELDAASGYTGDVGRWVAWFLGCLLRAVEVSDAMLEESKQKVIFFDHVRKAEINKRQATMLNMLYDGFEGKLTTAKWSKICKCSHDTALRDIESLINKGILMRSIEGGRSTSYELTALSS